MRDHKLQPSVSKLLLKKRRKFFLLLRVEKCECILHEGKKRKRKEDEIKIELLLRHCPIILILPHYVTNFVMTLKMYGLMKSLFFASAFLVSCMNSSTNFECERICFRQTAFIVTAMMIGCNIEIWNPPMNAATFFV